MKKVLIYTIISFLLGLSSRLVFNYTKSEIEGTHINYPQEEIKDLKEKLRISKLETDFYRDEFINCNK